MSNVLVVGGGLTAAVTSALLSVHAKDDKIKLSIWDKARGIGGRMSTSRSPGNSDCIADLGAQYVTATPHFQKDHKAYYDEFIAQGLIAPIRSQINGRNDAEPGTLDYVMPKGSSSIPKYFFQKSGLKVELGQFIESVTLNGKQWKVVTKDGRSEVFDSVILTMPVPQILQVAKEVLADKKDLRTNLEKVNYSSRYGLALFYDEDQTCKINLTNGAGSEYISGHPIFRFVSIDNVKRTGKTDGPTSVILHTSVPYGIKNVEKTVEELQPELVAAAEMMFPHWPKPAFVKCQKWRFSQVSNSFPGAPGCVVLHEDPLLLAGGDGFIHSNVDGCISSANRIDQIIRDKLNL